MRCISVKIMVISVRQKNVFYCQPFHKMRKFLLDMGKDFLIMKNFYLVEMKTDLQFYYCDKEKNTQDEQLCAHFAFFFFLIRIRDLQCRCNRRYFKRKVLQWARSRVTSALLLVQKVVLLLQILQTWIFSVSFQIRSFKTIPLTPLEILKTYPFSKQNNFLKNSFFPSAVIEWNNLHHNIWNVGSFSAFKNNVLKFIRPTPNNVFNCENNRGIKLITRLRVGFSHLRKHKFKHSFQDTLKPTWSCGFDVESTFNYSLHCPVYNDERHTLLSLIKIIDCRLLDVTETVLIKTFLFGNCSVDAHANTQILNATIECILTIKRFDESLFHF